MVETSPFRLAGVRVNNSPSSQLRPFCAQTLAWYASIQVDNTTYQLFGDALLGLTGTQTANQVSMDFTATRTSFLLTAGAMNVNISFLSSVEVCEFFLVQLLLLL